MVDVLAFSEASKIGKYFRVMEMEEMIRDVLTSNIQFAVFEFNNVIDCQQNGE